MTSTFKISGFLFSAFIACMSLSSCLGDNDSETVATNWQNATVSSFSFEDNSDVCSKLSSYAFTIDNFGTSDPALSSKAPNAGIIFNADSLPVGSVADSITVSLDVKNASSIIFNQYDDAGKLKKTTNFKDTQVVFFDDYAVTRLDIVSYDGNWKKSYFVKVNIHQVKGDTIRWQYNAKDLWDTAEVTDQNAETVGNDAYWFTEYSNSAVIMRKANMSKIAEWSEPVEIAGDEKPVVSTIFNWNNTLCAVGSNGSYMTSADGETWTIADAGMKLVNLLGIQYATKNYKEHLHAIVNQDGVYMFARTFDGESWELGDICPANFPIRNYSRPVSEQAKPSAGNVTSRVYIVGGELADGTITSSTWSCDGNSWAEFQQGFLPAMVRPSIIQYTLKVDQPKSFWILWPGVLEDGSVKNTPYFSENKGVTWKPMSKEFATYATTTPISAVGGVAAIINPQNYWMYFLGGIDADGKQQANVFGGQLLSLTFDQIK